MASPVRAERVEIRPPDGTILVGNYLPTPATGTYTVVLLHGLASTKAEWGPMADALRTAGCGMLAMDLRGHGESTQGFNQTLDYRYFLRGGQDWARMVADVSVVVDWLEQNGVPRRRIVVGGASLGANVALIAFSRDPVLAAAILLSPGLDYAGVTTEAAAAAAKGRRLAFAASPGDRYAFMSAERLADLSDGRFFRVRGAGHGVQMFSANKTVGRQDEGRPPLQQRLVRWLTGRRPSRPSR